MDQSGLRRSGPQGGNMPQGTFDFLGSPPRVRAKAAGSPSGYAVLYGLHKYWGKKPTECVSLGTVYQVTQEVTSADFLRHLPEPDEGPLTVEEIRSRWGLDAPSETTLYDKLKQYSAETPPKVERSGKGHKSSPFRFRKAKMVPSVRSPYTDGRIIIHAATPLPTPYPVGTTVRFKANGLPFEEAGIVRAQTSCHQFPGEVCYQIGSRTIPHSWIVGVEAEP